MKLLRFVIIKEKYKKKCYNFLNIYLMDYVYDIKDISVEKTIIKSRSFSHFLKFTVVILIFKRYKFSTFDYASKRDYMCTLNKVVREHKP